MSIHVSIKNNSNKMVKKISAHVLQCIDVAMFTGGHAKARVAGTETIEGCPISPGSTLNKVAKRKNHIFHKVEIHSFSDLEIDSMLEIRPIQSWCCH